MRRQAKPSLAKSLATVTACSFLLAAQLSANPSGGSVAAGSAAIAGEGTSAVTVTQTSSRAIINWNTFSIAQGETTSFIQPSATSAVLNRVLGGQTSVINGTLSANGQVYLVNGNGIVIGPSGIVNVAGFTASTRDIADADFLSGNLHFTGANSAGVQNLGVISALGGDVVLIGKTVSNSGVINAANGTAALVAADDVLLAQKNADGSTVTVSASPLATAAASSTAVSNTGTIAAAAAELKAANGNLYALAIQNSGVIRATTVQNQGGRIWLVADTGTVSNTGKLDASASTSKGAGGSVTVKDMGGTVIDSGAILATGGQGGAGGSAEVSGDVVQFSGTVDFTASGGATGTLFLDPTTFTVAASGGDETGAAVSAALATANIVLNADNAVTINDAIAWTSANTLTLSTNLSGSTIAINAAITGANGGLTISTAGAADAISATAPVNVASFILQNGAWVQSAASLPGFSATSDFEIQGGTFLRVLGGNGTSGNPYELTDVYGLQGVNGFLSSDFELANNVDASGTATWNSGAGFTPIGGSTAFSGTFDGAGHVVFDLTIDTTWTYVGLFGANAGTIENLGVANASVAGGSYVGGLVGYNTGNVTDDYVTGNVSGAYEVGGLVGYNSGNVTNDYATAVVSGDEYAGGLVGINWATVTSSYATGAVSGSFLTGGLIGDNIGPVEMCYATGNVTGNTYVGGLVGANDGAAIDGSFSNSYATGNVTGTTYVGALAGGNWGTVATSYWLIGTAAGAVGQNFVDGTVTGTTGETLAALQTQSTFSGWDFTNTWVVASNNGVNTTPLLRSLSATISGGTVGTRDIVVLISANGTSYATTASGGVYSFLVADDALTAGALLMDATAGQTSVAYTAGANPGETITGVNLTRNFLTLDGAGVMSNALLGALSADFTTAFTANSEIAGAYGFPPASQGLVNYAVDSNNALTTASGVGLTINSGYKMDGNLVVNGTLTLNNGTTLVAAHDVATSGFILESGTWEQIVGVDGLTALPTFTDSGDFELQGGTFERFAGGDGSTTNPYQISDVYGLQGIDSASLLADSFVLTNDIDASGTAAWNSGAGFTPIGNSSTPFTGTLDGLGFTVGNLTINSPSTNYVGLFGQSNGTIETLGLVNASVSSALSSATGALVGENYGTITGVYTTGMVTGDGGVSGGIVGDNGATGVISQSYSTASVSDTSGSGGANIGGLAGRNYGAITDVYATGNVTGATYEGGIVGTNFGDVTNAYATGDVSRSSASLVGYNGGSLAGLYFVGTGTGVASGTTTGTTAVASLADLAEASTYTGWDFTPGTGVWGVAGYTSNGEINDGLPYFQWQYPTIALVATNQSVAYGDAANLVATLETTYTIQGLGNGTLSDYVTGNVTLAPDGSNVNAGTTNAIDVSATPASANYAVEYVDGTETITQRAITVSSDSGQTKVYGTSDPASAATAYTVTSGSLVGNDTLTGGMGRVAGETVGSYDFTQGSVGVSDGNSGDNYAITFDGSTNPFTITAASLTATIASMTKVYGTNDPSASGVTVTLGGVVDTTVTDLNGDTTVLDDTCAVAVTLACLTRTAGENVGNYTITGATFNTLTGSAASNYAAPTALTGSPTLSITPATLTYTANTVTTYAGGIPALTGTVTGFVNGDTQQTATTGTLSFTTPATASSPAGNYAIDGSGLGAINYVFVQAADNATALTIRGYQTGRPFLPSGQLNPFFNFSVLAGQPSIPVTPTPTLQKAPKTSGHGGAGNKEPVPAGAIAFGSSYTTSP